MGRGGSALVHSFWWRVLGVVAYCLVWGCCMMGLCFESERLLY